MRQIPDLLVGNDGLQLRHPIAFERRELQAAAGYRRPAGAQGLEARRKSRATHQLPDVRMHDLTPVNRF